MAFDPLLNYKVFLEDTTVVPSVYYRLHVSKNISFSQTFSQSGRPVKTLHNQKAVFEGSIINTANPANFSIELYLVDENTTYQHKPLDFLINYSGNNIPSFNLHFVNDSVSPNILYKLSTCVITEGTFNLDKTQVMSVNLEGSASKLTHTTGTYNYTHTGYVTSSNTSFAIARAMQVAINGTTLSHIKSVSIELQNSISWIPNKTLQASKDAVSATTSIYPSSYVLRDRALAGSIVQYVNEGVSSTTDNLLKWGNNVSLSIKAGLSAANYQLEIDVPAISFTNRNVVGEFMAQSYDFRSISNPSDLNSYFIY